jgi:hypothetical protein
MTEQELLCDCLRRLSNSKFHYMLVGSMAGNYWGIPRSTHDIDFVIQYDTDSVDDLVSLFADEFFIQRSSVEAALAPPYQFNALDSRSALKVDVFRLAGDDYELQRFSRRRRVKILGEDAFIAAPEDIILHKLRWYTISAADRQLTDSAGIMAVSGPTLDHAYLDDWAGKIDVLELLAKVRDLAK